MSGPINIEKLCADAGEDKFSKQICSKLAKSCLKQQENEVSTFVLVDREGKAQKFGDVDTCLKHSVLIPSGKKPTSEGAGTAPTGSEVCAGAGLNASQEASCKNAADACASGEGAFEIVTDAGPVTAKNQDKCFKLAVTLPQMGYVIEGAHKAAKPAPAPKPVVEPVYEPPAPTPSAPTPKPKPKPVPKPAKKPAKKKVAVPPAKPTGGSHICYEKLNKDQIKFWIKGHGVTQITGILMCKGAMIGSLTMGRYGDEFHAGPIDKCYDGSFPKLSTKYSLDPDVEDAGTRPTDPKKFMDWRCPKKSLKVNKGYKHYYSPKARDAGESDLRQQCKKAKVEEGFYFIEGFDKSGKPLSYWFERGYNEKSDHTDTSINSCFSFGIQAEFSSITGISHYHFHPTSGYSNFGSEFPSTTDFDSTIETALDKYDTRFGFNPKVFDRRVVTTTGVWIMKLDFDAIQSDPDGAKKDVDRYDAARKKIFKDIKKKKLKHLSRAEQCALFAEQATSKYVEVTFEPF
jgi:hypothetical protein